MKLKLITPPATLPVSLVEAKNHYRVIGNEEDDVITASLTAATQRAEQITNRQLITATYEGYLNAFCSEVKLPKPPFKSVSKVEYVDVEGATKIWNDYYIDDVAEPAVMYFSSFPSDAKTEGVNNVIITYICGYDTTPEAIKSWIKVSGLTLFEDRNLSKDDLNDSYINRLLDSYRIIPV
jgi:uncharacterized phiE125 gp8 family phage protein